MSSSKELQWVERPSTAAEAGRRVVASALHSTSAVLARLARGLARQPSPAISDPRFEFHAEAGAPEGALYVDGRFVGWVPGVSRL